MPSRRLRAGRTRSIGLVIPDLENTSYTRIANYRTPGAPAWLPIADRLFRRSAGQRNALYRAPAAARWTAIIVSHRLPPEHRSINAGPTIRCRSSLDRALDRSISSASSGADQETLCAGAGRTPSRLNRCCIGALPELSVSFLREQGFRQAWQEDPPSIICTPTAMNVKPPARCLPNG